MKLIPLIFLHKTVGKVDDSDFAEWDISLTKNAYPIQNN